MSDNVIKLLPDNVANQIAAGEVIQRPASVVKELLENAVDSGAKNIHVIVKEAGKTLIQIIDDGCGMSSDDALVCFKRHATSKLKSAEDLFSISTKGFRGEALASIASIAHVVLRTKTKEKDTGFECVFEGGKNTSTDECALETGTSISVKNLFFNVPARRKFLKSNAVEGKHINEEFSRIALIHPEVAFTLTVNDDQVYNLPFSSFKQRIVNMFGKSYKERLVPIAEETDFITVSGFILKPEFAKKSRGEQYFFFFFLFIKHNYFHHAIKTSFEDLIAANSHPSYFVKLEVNPNDLDVNIHPTKTEVKFADERSIYAIMKAGAQRSLNMHSLAPTLDFDQETSFDTSPINWNDPVTQPEIQVDKSFNPFTTDSADKNNGSKNSEKSNWEKGSAFSESRKNKNQDWQSFYKDDSDSENTVNHVEETPAAGYSNFEEDAIQLDLDVKTEQAYSILHQIKKKFILTSNASGLIIINQKRAHERVLFEHFIQSYGNSNINSQQLLFPETIDFSPKDWVLAKEIIPLLIELGFDVNEFGKTSMVINGVPSDLTEVNAKEVIESTIEQFTSEKGAVKLDRREQLAVNMAKRIAIPYGQELSLEEMKNLVEQLFLCENNRTSPTQKPIQTSYGFGLMEKQLS